MKTKLFSVALLAAGTLALGGCVSIPPLVQVAHKEVPAQNVQPSSEVLCRLDAIEKRLDRMEERLERK